MFTSYQETPPRPYPSIHGGRGVCNLKTSNHLKGELLLPQGAPKNEKSLLLEPVGLGLCKYGGSNYVLENGFCNYGRDSKYEVNIIEDFRPPLITLFKHPCPLDWLETFTAAQMFRHEQENKVLRNRSLNSCKVGLENSTPCTGCMQRGC